jgi:small neutral amino acid transporter SnatA (MarC family)
LKTAFYVTAILAIFMMFGRFVLNFFGISLPVLKIAGGLIVAKYSLGHGDRVQSHDDEERLRLTLLLSVVLYSFLFNNYAPRP